ncbi:serine/threonine-protein kinase PknA [Haloferax gibbonsii ATCC 33959]|uniref:Serine/threonine-protein kinase PknA n=1 Tax=Haloferax gibbonsii (strain ATCC 33959 / DSM 4427 / JCM 8863 / NBRC 102184 / NCIMB 2188 / Ma 2.38) TaxID=1227459 RepID=M0HUY3_HALGM|nr:FHA domain-containing serine/threonine-protein kinase [Haloferax gibbonsii]ELZ86929.1 serine/threonine-protein kinase PknA [Haloferax gibbonsii ATCC 33959]
MGITPSKGSRLGNYVLKDQLGVGGFGNVWLAEDTTTGDQVAIKIPRYGQVNETILDKYVSREEQALSKIRQVGGHPNLMNLIDTVTQNGSLCLVVDFVSGDELGDVVERNGGLPVEKARQIGIEICDAVSFLHQHELVYRDLKPDNVILDGLDNPTVIDFTTVKEVDLAAISPTKQNGGSGVVDPTDVGGYEQFKPPEIVNSGQGDQGPWSDVYSLGKTIFFMLTNQDFGTDGLRPSDVGSTSCPDYMDEIVARATATDPDDRYSSATGLKHALERQDPSPPITAKLFEVGNGTYDIKDGHTIGRDEDPPTNTTVSAEYVSRVHCRLSRDASGNWWLEDESTNGTYLNPSGDSSDGDWEWLLSPDGQQRYRSKGRTVEATTDSKRLTPGDTFVLVDPNYDESPWFIFQGEN